MLEAEMDVKLGYSRDEATKKNTDNSRNGIHQRPSEVNWGQFSLIFQGIVMANSSLKSFRSTNVMYQA
jgi:hypothetical protein